MIFKMESDTAASSSTVPGAYYGSTTRTKVKLKNAVIRHTGIGIANGTNHTHWQRMF